MGLAFTLDERFWGDFTLDNLNSRQFAIVCGQFAYDSASSTALTVTQALVGLRDILGFVACPKGNLTFNFDPANDTLTALVGGYSSATGLYTFCATASQAVTSVTSIPFLCWGFR